MKKTVIVYGNYSGIQINAIKYLSEIILDYTGKFPVCISHTEFKEDENSRYIFIGTKENNPYIKKLSDKELTHREEYYIKVFNDNAIIEGSDEGGVLYGCIDFYGKYIVNYPYTHTQEYFKNIFESKLPEFEYVSRPSCRDRGLWTWGHCIYDYKGYLNNMAMLNLNTIIVWNDFPPINAEEFVSYAHSLNIKVIWGFSFLWDTAFDKLDINNTDKYIDGIVNYYTDNYSKLSGDGIYFQSFTELKTDNINGIIIAEAVTDFVNKVSATLLDKYPGLILQFGLHATSVRERLELIKNVDKRVAIIWEDCGAFPFNYIPEKIDDFEETYKFAEKISVLRGQDDKFGAVLKGCVCLDWTKFEHQSGKLYIGGTSENVIRKIKGEKAKIWKYVQAYWLRNADKAYEMIKLLTTQKNGELCITVLVEDGAFERGIYYPVALYSEMLWNTKADVKDLMCSVALRENVEFV